MRLPGAATCKADLRVRRAQMCTVAPVTRWGARGRHSFGGQSDHMVRIQPTSPMGHQKNRTGVYSGTVRYYISCTAVYQFVKMSSVSSQCSPDACR